MADEKEAAMELPLPASSVHEDSIFDVTDETLDVNLLILGLDNAGKTTLLYMLKDDKIVQHMPTLHPQSEEIIIDKIRFRAFDLAGHETGRPLWKNYIPMAGAIMFMVDSADRSRFLEAAEELAHLLKEPKLVKVPIAVLGQKTDLKDAASQEEFRSAMGLDSRITSGHIAEVFMCSIVQKCGYGDAVRWMQKMLLELRQAAVVLKPSAAPAASPAPDAFNDGFDDLC